MRTAAQQQAGQLKSGFSSQSQLSSQGFSGVLYSVYIILSMQEHYIQTVPEVTDEWHSCKGCSAYLACGLCFRTEAQIFCKPH